MTMKVENSGLPSGLHGEGEDGPSATLPLPGIKPPPEPLGRLLARWARRAIFMGISLSVVAHVMFLAIAYAVPLGDSGTSRLGNTDAAGASGVEMAVMSAEQFGALEEAAIDSSTPAIADAPPTDLPGIDLKDAPGGGGMADTGELGAVGTGLGGAGSGTGIGIGDGAGGSGGGGAKFFGVEARGQRFAFVCDISGSMSEQGKLSQLKIELERSLDGMVETAQFAVYFFESDAVPLNNRQQWAEANSKNKAPAFAKIKDLVARGGTNPLPAFAMALALKPRPDAIYFMTDGLFDTDVVTQLSAMNRSGKKVPIHCIAFGDRSAEVPMKKIAEESGGTYTYVVPRGAK